VKYMHMQDKSAIITGGSGGLGLAIAKRLAASGCNLVVSGRTAERGAQAVEELKMLGVKAVFVKGDSGDYENCKRIVARAREEYGGIDILISAGAEGPFGPKPFRKMSPDELKESFASRFFPRIFPVHAAADALEESKGCVVLITTDAARFPTSGESVIGAVGASVILMTKTLGREFSRANIRINSVAMTLTSDTPSWDRIFNNDDFERKVFSKALERFPQNRAPTADEVAGVATFLASDEAGQITGQTVSVNGGLSFGGW
jgi:2-hydroxycyclohexanecarboxyl-CoA dehydrogenase